jgi:diguanylate cyclase (GGDEF)-like protein/PAS domain S-box-containing protein
LEWISPSVSDVFGWKPEELSGQPISAFISTGDWQRVAGVLDASRHPGMDAAGVFRIRRRNGSPIWVQATSSTVHTHDGEVVRIARLRDVDAETRARLDLQRSEERFRAAMSSTPVGMALVTRSGRFLKVNQALCRMLKQTESELTGAMVNTVTHPQDRPIDMEMWNLLHSGARRSVTREKRLVDTRGGILWVQQALATVTDDDGERTSFVAQFVDTTATHEAQAVLAFQANHDPLTDLMNRRAVIDTIAAVLSHPPRTGTELGVLYCDFDHFKAINDKSGHQVGDDLLVEVARRIRRCVRAGDTVGRIGGDEFVVLLTQIHNIGDALRIGEKIRATVAQPLAIGDAVFTPTVSMGAAVATHGEDPNTVLSNADRALYAAKDAGRNRVEGFSDTVA